MAIDKRLQVFDAEGNPVDYDILATDVKFNDGEDLPTKLAELEEEIGEGGYNPPEGGIPATDLAPAVQTSLGKADTAYQKPASGIPASDIAPGVIPDVSGLATKTEVNTGLADKVDKETGKSLMTDAEHSKLEDLPTNPVQSVTINGTNHTPTNGVVDLGNVVGAQGPKGDTGNVQVDGNGNVLIVNNLEDGGTGAALSAEMGKRLALKAGTYAGAWARSKAVIVPFCWLWTETVGGAAICKPIWHIGNSVFIDAAGGVVSVQASAIPAAPTFSETSGSTVGKGTELTITPAVDSALYYKIDNGNWIISDIAVTIEINATCTVTAKCVNNAGSSSEVACSLTVSGPQTPRFSAKPGTTIDNNNVVSRGGYVVITGEAGGTLNYKVNEGSYIGVQSVGGAAPTAEVQITEAKTIMAYNTINGENSAVITQPYTMATLAAPTLTMSSTSGDPTKPNEFPEGGGTITINGPAGARIYYTTDGSAPSKNSTQYNNNSPIPVTGAGTKTIKAISVDDYGSSSVTEGQYTVLVVPQFKFKIRLTDDNSTEYVPCDQGYRTVDGQNTRQYTMIVDWGDGSTSSYNGQSIMRKNCSHQYTGDAGDEFIITIKANGGNLQVPSLLFGGDTGSSFTAATQLYNPDSLVSILENSLTCETYLTLGGTNVESVSADAMQNSVSGWTSLPMMASYPTGLLNHLQKEGHYLTSCKYMFYNWGATTGGGDSIILTPAMMAELKASISHVTDFSYMFYEFLGVCAIPDDFFDGVAANSVTTVQVMTSSTTNGGNVTVTGDAKALYDVLKDKVTADAVTDKCFKGGALTNKNQVPTTWGGTMS